MPMSFAGRVASSSDCAARPRERETGLTGFAVPIRRSSLTGLYVMATAEHREPCESRGSCTVLGAPGGEIPPGDSTRATFERYPLFVGLPPDRYRHGGRRGTHAVCQKQKDELH